MIENLRNRLHQAITSQAIVYTMGEYTNRMSGIKVLTRSEFLDSCGIELCSFCIILRTRGGNT